MSGVAKGRFDEVFDGEVGVGGGGDDEGVFSRGLGEELELGVPALEEVGGEGGAGEDDAVDLVGGDEGLADFVIGAREELEGVARDAGGPEAVDHFPSSLNDFGGGFDDYGITHREGGEDSAAGDGAGEVPRRGDDDGAEGGGFAAVEEGGV